MAGIEEKQNEGFSSGKKKPRGFAAMDPCKMQEIASLGGKKAQESGKAHRFTSEEARVAGSKGGLATGKRNRAKKKGKA